MSVFSKIFFSVFSLLLLISCSSHPQVIFDDNINVKVEIAKTIEERQNGLMNRNFLEENEGMLFIFDDFKERSFWMKNTLISLDMIFIDKNLKITKILEADPCKEDPCDLYKGDAMYVLEVNKGFCDKNDIKEGEFVKLKL